MKIFNIIKICLPALLFAFGSCTEEMSPWEQRQRNTGTETLDVNADELAFLPRGGKLNFTVNATCDHQDTVPYPHDNRHAAGIFPSRRS